MDIQRILLIGAIAVVSYLLLIEWQQFSQNGVPPTTAQEQTLPSMGSNEGDLPTAASSDDIPVVTTAQAVPEKETASQQLVQVNTDVLQVSIDPLGGDLVAVALPTHLKSLKGDGSPFQLLRRDQQLYIAQSGLVGSNGTDTSQGRPTFSVSQWQYQLAEGQDELVVDLELKDVNGADITKRFRFRRGDYLVDVEYLINNRAETPWKANFYAQLKRDNTPDPSAESGGLGMQPFLGVATTTDDERFKKIAFDDISDERFRAQKQDGWIAIIQHYFLTAWIPQKGQSYEFSTLITRDGYNLARAMGPSVTIAPGEQGSLSSQFYAGPKDQYRLETIADGLDLSVDYGWLWWVAQPLFWLLTKFYALSQNWGIAIILLTVLVKAVFFYPSALSYRSMAKMRKIQPKLLALREQYPDDRQKQSQEMMNLYRKEGVNPLGGCLPILIQMPVFIALYWVLLESVELRHAPFVGYIQDLSSMDPYFILPLIMGASMWFQQKLNPPPPDPTQAKIMQFLPVIFTFFFLWFPAGLVLYWVVNNLLSILQQWVITKQIEAAD